MTKQGQTQSQSSFFSVHHLTPNPQQKENSSHYYREIPQLPWLPYSLFPRHQKGNLRLLCVSQRREETEDLLKEDFEVDSATQSN